MDAHDFGIILIALASIAAAVFTVAPIIPGTLFIFVGALAFGLVDSFEPFAWWFWIAQVALAVIYIAIDNIAQLLGVQKAGASREAMIGGTVGVVIAPIVLAPVSGPFALLLGPPIGAVAGTLIGEAKARRTPANTPPSASYRRLGTRALISFIVGTVVKFTVLGVQIALLVIVAT